MLDAYFKRVDYRGPASPDLETLTALMQAHVTSIPFENLDVQLGRKLTIAPEEAFTKIVERNRGGWCYEQNGLFGLILSEIGYEVVRVAAAVMRQDRGDVSSSNHLCLLVRCPGSTQTYLADVGFGGSLWQPIELREGAHEHAPYRIGLRTLDDGHWQFWEDLGEGEFSYDFEAGAGDEDALAARCEYLQTDPASSFVLNLVAQKRAPDRHFALRGRVLKTSYSGGSDARMLDSADELEETLRDLFRLDVPGITDLWPRIVARHDELFS